MTTRRGEGLPCAPLDYPGVPAPAPLLLGPDGSLALHWDGGRLRHTGRAPGQDDGVEVDALLRSSGAPELADRVPVLAIGSNRVPAVMAAKLAAAGAGSWLPMAPAVLLGVAVGHSAHISRGGYVAAAPYVRPGARTEVVVGWLAADQLAAIDATEPNYRRVPLGDLGTVSAVHGPLVSRVELYVSRHGVLAAGGEILPFGSQLELYGRLAAVPALAGLAPWLDADPEAVVRVIRGAQVGAEFRRVTAAGGYAQDSGFPAGAGGSAAG